MRRILLLATAVLAGCVSRPAPPPPAPPPPPAAAAAAPTGHGRLAVPPRLADGRFATPNSDVSAAGALWNLRAGLNVAALSCRGAQEAALTAAYNGLLQRHRAAFDQAYRTLGREYGDAARFDEAMTALYNYYALTPARAGLCATAQQVLAEAAALSPAELTDFAPAALTRLDAPYQQVFAEQDAYLAAQSAGPVAPAQTVAAVTPRIAIDMTVLRMP